MKSIRLYDEEIQRLIDADCVQVMRLVKPGKHFNTQCRHYLPHPNGGWRGHDGLSPDSVPACSDKGFLCPYGNQGDTLWVRETWGIDTNDLISGRNDSQMRYCVVYKASWSDANYYHYEEKYHWGWMAAHTMKQWASRFTVRIDNISIVNDLSKQDAINCGIKMYSRKGLSGWIDKYGYKAHNLNKHDWSHMPDDAVIALWNLWAERYQIGEYGNKPWLWRVNLSVVDKDWAGV